MSLAPTRVSSRPRLLAIASGKGGVGKTWLAVTLSRALVLAGRSVLLFDGDLGLANVDIQLGLMPQHDLMGVIAGRRSLGESVTRHEAGGFGVLAGRSGTGIAALQNPAVIDRILTGLASECTVSDVVLDLGAGLDLAVRRMAAAADTLLVVATDEPTSLTDAYAVLKLAEADQPGGDVRIVINQARTRAGGERTYATLAQASATFLRRKPPLAGIIRRDEHVPDTIRRQTLLQIRHPNTAAVQDVESLASDLLR